MPWAPELFSAPVLARLEEQRQRTFVTVPFFDGLMTGELDALLGSFAGEPEVHHPVRGRIRGRRAFAAFAREMNDWLTGRDVSVEEVMTVVERRQGLGEAVLHLDGENGRVGLPVAVIADKRVGGRIKELRLYFTSWPLTGRHSNRPPVLQPDPDLREPALVSSYARALADGDVDAIVAAFEPDGQVRGPAGDVHAGPDGLRAFHERLFSGGGGIDLERCALIDDDRACALEYNVVRWGGTDVSPQAGVAVFVRGPTGRLAAARIYDDVSPPRALGTMA